MSADPVPGDEPRGHRYAGRLQDAVDLGIVRSDLLSTVDRALEPAHVTVWTAPAAIASRPG